MSGAPVRGFMTQVEYAEHRGVAKSYITKLKKEGRLVLDSSGLVDVAASDRKVASTSDPARDDVAERHAVSRQTSVSPERSAADMVGNSYQQARAVKEKFLALEAKRAYEQAIGQLREAREVEGLAATAMTELRLRLENLATSLAPMVAGMQDEAKVRAVLQDHFAHALESASHHFSRLSAGSKT